MNIKTKGVAFNLDDPNQLKMFNHLSQMTNYSSYLKLLIWQDLQGLGRTVPELAPAMPDNSIDVSLMEDLV